MLGSTDLRLLLFRISRAQRASLGVLFVASSHQLQGNADMPRCGVFLFLFLKFRSFFDFRNSIGGRSESIGGRSGYMADDSRHDLGVLSP